MAAEVDDTAARGRIARCPFQFREARHDRRTQGAREMMAPLAPVQASLANGPAGMAERVGEYLQVLLEETRAFGGQFDILLFLPQQLLLLHAVQHLHPEVAGKV